MIIYDLDYLELVSDPNVVGGATAPECVTKNVSANPLIETATITNNCDYTVSVRGIWDFAFDDSCQTLKPGQSYSSARGGQASLARVDLC